MTRTPAPTTTRIGFVVIAHGDRRVLHRLVDRLADAQSTVGIAVHYDRKSGELDVPRRLTDLVAVVEAPLDVKWGDWTLIEAVARGIHTLDACFPEHNWTILLSGQDYPTRALSELACFLADTNADAFIECRRAIDNWGEEEVSHRYGYDYAALPGWLPARYICSTARRLPFLNAYRLEGGKNCIGIRRRRDLVALLGGSGWFIANRRATAAIVRAAEDDRTIRLFRRSIIPDESFFATVLAQADCEIVAQRWQYCRFAREGAPHPDILTEAHLPEIVASRAFFARKCTWDTSAGLLDALDLRLRPMLRYAGRPEEGTALLG